MLRSVAGGWCTGCGPRRRTGGTCRRSRDNGFVDLVLCHPATGEFLMVELKRPPNKVEPDQKVWHRALEACGVNVQVWFVPDELDEWVAYLSNQRLKARRT